MDLEPDAVAELPRKQRAVVTYIQENPMASAGLTLEQLAEVLGVNASTIIRAVQSLGYKGFADLRQDLRHQYLSTLDPLEVFEANRQRLTGDHPIAAQLQADIHNLTTLLGGLDPGKVERFAVQIAQARSVLIASSGSYAAVGLVLAHLCRFLGYPVELEDRGGSYLAHRLTNLTGADLLIGVTFWRGSRDVVQALEWAEGRRIPTACITDSSGSRVARASRVALVAPTESTSFYHSLTASLSTAYAVVNALWQHDPAHAERSARDAQQLYRDFQLQTPAARADPTPHFPEEEPRDHHPE